MGLGLGVVVRVRVRVTIMPLASMLEYMHMHRDMHRDMHMHVYMHTYAYASQVSMLEAAKLMAEGRLNRLLVTSAEGSADLIGIISSTDLVFALLGCGKDANDDGDGPTIDPRRLGNLYRPGIY